MALIVANWKMHKTTNETKDFIDKFIPLVQNVKDIEIVIAPPFTCLSVANALVKDTNIKLAAQDIFWELEGAYTGEISGLMLKDVGCSYVIIGHSERRKYFYENDEIINKKIKAALKIGINVILCIGETLQQRETGQTFSILSSQLRGGLKEISINNIVIAYEPIWAIGTGKTATPTQAQQAHGFIRGELKNIYKKDVKNVKILYGGSVKPENISSLMQQKDIDGVLVGGASLDPESFAKIVKFKGE